jgi:glycerol-3-phosphate dehydrogenase
LWISVWYFFRCQDGSTIVPWSTPSREEEISALKSQQFDVLVIGGGCVGAGVALDAASRGLNVALVERSDFSAGTSSRSTKLVHGGIR